METADSVDNLPFLSLFLPPRCCRQDSDTFLFPRIPFHFLHTPFLSCRGWRREGGWLWGESMDFHALTDLPSLSVLSPPLTANPKSSFDPHHRSQPSYERPSYLPPGPGLMLRQKSIGMSPARVGVRDAGGEREAGRVMVYGDNKGGWGCSFLLPYVNMKLSKELRLCCWANLGLNPGSCPSQLCDQGEVASPLWAWGSASRKWGHHCPCLDAVSQSPHHRLWFIFSYLTPFTYSFILQMFIEHYHIQG